MVKVKRMLRVNSLRGRRQTEMDLAQWKSGQFSKKVTTRVPGKFKGGKTVFSTSGAGTTG